MNYRIIPVTAFAQNCSLIWCEQTKLAALVDPGGDAERIKQEVAAAGVSLMQILLTHGHLDHVGAAAELAQHYGVPIIGPEKEDEFWLEGLPAQSRMFGLEDCQPLQPESLAERRRYGQRGEYFPAGAALPRPYAGARDLLRSCFPTVDFWRCDF